MITPPAEADVLERRIYPEWSSILDGVHMRMRATVLEAAWKDHDQAIAKLGKERAREKHAMGFGSGISALTYAALIPFHLLDDDEDFAFINQLYLDKGDFEVMEYFHEKFPAQMQPLLAIGDQGLPTVIHEALDEHHAEERIGSIVVGPGAGLESIVRDWARTNFIPQNFIKAIDSSNGYAWRNLSAGITEKRVHDLFKIYNPGSVLVFDPVIESSTRQAMHEATLRKLKTWTSRRVTASLFMEKQREEELRGSDNEPAKSRNASLAF